MMPVAHTHCISWTYTLTHLVLCIKGLEKARLHRRVVHNTDSAKYCIAPATADIGELCAVGVREMLVD